MALILAHATDNPAQAVTLFSLLESGGFHPEIFGFHHGFIAIAYVGALGGFRLMLPEHEIDSAKTFLKTVQPTSDYDPIRPRLMKDIIYASILTMNPFFGLYLLPLALLSLIYAVTMIAIFMIGRDIFIGIFISSLLIPFVIAIRAHATYIALPALRTQNDSSRPI
ncbi:MAG: hypothetical protein ABJG88_01110 [Litorimonas sp.]